MVVINYEDKLFLYKKINNVNIVTSLADCDFPMHPQLASYYWNLHFIKKHFNLSTICTLSQTHSDIVHVCTEDFLSGIEGDGLVTNLKSTALGVFTADCVPIFIFDTEKNVVSAVHSGWQGTYKEIVNKSIDLFIKEYKSNIENIQVYIGPHNMKCCYEIGDDLKDKFLNHETFKNNPNIFHGNNLNMVKCIKMSLNTKGVLNNNIHIMNYCTYCSTDPKFYSYRRNKESLNRIFSFIFID